MMQTPTIAVAATFTADLLEGPLAFWMQEVEAPARIAFAPYNQLFQQLLDPNSLLGRNSQGVNVVLVRLEDWHRPESSAAGGLGDASYRVQLRRTAEEFVAAVVSAAERSGTPHLIGLCPSSPALSRVPEWRSCLRETEEWIVARLRDRGGVYVITGDEIQAAYPVADWSDPDGDEMGRVPYTTAFYTALGTVLARKGYALRSPPRKVIAIDCDETLWKGVCGELGPLGVEVDGPRKILQEFLVEQRNGGALLCLCSKNAEEDVWEVFDRRPEMPLRREHLVASRINWQAKSTNLRELAAELGLGLDSFVFIDDSPVECAEVEANCPAVLTLRLPERADETPAFLRQVWAFDRLTVTAEDRQRSDSYRQNGARERLRRESPTLVDFLTNLRLQVCLFDPKPADLARVAQLTQRTNQFNCTTVRRTEGELRRLVSSRAYRCLAVEVSDRFGDYGLVGATLFRASAAALEVDTFLLSCRVLGRGVEHRMLRELGALAAARGLARVDVPFVPSRKNQAARDFLERAGGQFRHDTADGFVFRFPAEEAARLEYRGESASADGARTGSVFATDAVAPAPPLARIARELGDVRSILAAINARRRVRRGATLMLLDAPAAPRTPVEETLADIWSEVLGVEPVGIHDNFFQLGGDSLLATQVVSRLRRAFGVQLPLGILFDAPTVAGQAVMILEAMTDHMDGDDMIDLLDELERAGEGGLIEATGGAGVTATP